MDDINMDLTYTESMRLICAFKKHAILWNSCIRGYHNREGKEEAWKIVAAESSIHPEVCKRKMKSFVSSCRREKIKIIKSRATGNPGSVYKPQWRYWNALKFLRGVDDNEEDPLGTAPEQNLEDRKERKPYRRRYRHQGDTQAFPVPVGIVSRTVGVNQAAGASQAPGVQAARTSGQDPTAKAQTKEIDDEYTAIGVTVEAKLRKMNYDQRLFAENIINQALYKGLLFQLTESSEITNTGPAPAKAAHHLKAGRKGKRPAEVYEDELYVIERPIKKDASSDSSETSNAIEEHATENQPYFEKVLSTMSFKS